MSLRIAIIGAGLAEGLTLRTEATVTDGRALLADHDRVLSTAPLPQTAALGHRWRYARVSKSHIAPKLPDRCCFAGDALAASRVEDAWLAGRAAARKIIQSQSNY